MASTETATSQGHSSKATRLEAARRAVGMPGHHKLIFLALLALLIAAPFFAYPVFLMKVLCFALFAAAFNLLLGYGGLLSFGHSAYFGMASYVCAHAAKVWGLTPELSILAGTLVSGLLGLAIGALAIRRSGIYFAMVTLAFAQMVFFFSLQAPFTGGEDGIQGVPRGALFGLFDLNDDRALYWLVLAVFMGGVLAIYRIVHSPFGQVLKAIRDNEPRAISLGYRVYRYKLAVFVLSASLAGAAGATKAMVFRIASLTDVHWTMSGEVVLMTLIGGMGTIFGPIVGAAVVVSMQNYLAELGAWVLVVQGSIFVICVLLFREGIVGVIGRWFRRPL
jgi:branched-chain amino acid transport system permease protein